MPRKIGETRHNPYKLIDTWYYKVEDIEIDRLDYQKDAEREDEKYKPRKERIKNKTVSIEVRMEKKTEHSSEPPHPLASCHIELVCSELNIRMKGTDFEALRAAMWGCLDKKFEVKWERYYLVEISASRIYGGDGSGVVFEYKDVYRGTTWSGNFLMKLWRGHDQKIEVWPGEFKDSGGKVIACIPATEENKKALEEFGKRIDQIRSLMADFLRPDKILATLADLSKTMPFLPPIPPEEKKDEEQPIEVETVK